MNDVTKNNIDVSVVIAAWNSAEFIQQAIDSALNQQGVTVELIIVDDCSTDNTCDVVAGYNDPRVHLMRSQCNGGPGSARNIGFSVAKGEWIAILDSDDYFLPSRLKDMLRHDDGKTDILIDHFLMREEGQQELQLFFEKNELEAGEFPLSYFIQSNSEFMGKKTTGYIKPIFRREFIEKEDVRYWPEVRIGEDYYYLACCLSKSARARVIDVSGYIYTVRSGSISSELTLDHITKFEWADNKFLNDNHLNSECRNAQKKRSKNLLKTKSYLQLVGLIKSKKIVSALIQGVKHPNACLFLWLPIRKRLMG